MSPRLQTAIQIYLEGYRGFLIWFKECILGTVWDMGFWVAKNTLMLIFTPLEVYPLHFLYVRLLGLGFRGFSSYGWSKMPVRM